MFPFIPGLSKDTTEEKLKEFFEQFGAISDCTIIKDPSSKLSFCFSLSHSFFPLSISLTPSHSFFPLSLSFYYIALFLYLSLSPIDFPSHNLPPVEVSRGFGFITFETVEEVDKCLEKKTGLTLDDRQIEVKRAIPKDGQGNAKSLR